MLENADALRELSRKCRSRLHPILGSAMKGYFGGLPCSTSKRARFLKTLDPCHAPKISNAILFHHTSLHQSEQCPTTHDAEVVEHSAQAQLCHNGFEYVQSCKTH